VPVPGETLVADSDLWLGAPAVSRQWIRCDALGTNCSDIPGETGTSHTVTDGDVGHTLNVRETATENGLSSTADFIPTGVAFIPFATFTNQSLAPGDATQMGRIVFNETPSSCEAPNPTPQGIAETGDALFFDVFATTSLVNEPACVVAARSDSPGQCSSTILAAYSPAFAPASALDNYVADDAISNHLSYTLASGATAQAVVTQMFSFFGCDSYDLFIGSVTPFATALPALSGTAVQGRPFDTSDGAWNGSPAFAQGWLRCDADGAGCTPIGGATGSSYVPGATDVGHRIRSRVTAKQHGSASADSPPSEVVAPDTTASQFLAASLTNTVFAVNRRGVSEVSPAGRTRRPRRGTRFRYRLSEDAVVTFTILRARPGRRVRGKCVRPRRKNRGKRKCTRFVRAGRFQVASTAGDNSHRFSGRINQRSLRPGRYRAVLRATDAASNVSAARRLRFRIVRLRPAS
jgi:hypothetical protein